MISICAPTFDINGEVISQTGAAVLQSASRRAKRVATLDGSATLVDGGFSTADLTYQCQFPDQDGDHHLALTGLIANHSTAVMSCERGCYSVLLSALSFNKGLTIITAEVLEVA